MKPTRIRAGTAPHFYLKEWMKAKGFTQQSLADRMGVERNTVNRYVHEQWRLRPHKIAEIAYVLGLDDWRQLTQIPPPPEPKKPEPALADELDELRARMAELSRRLKRRAS